MNPKIQTLVREFVQQYSNCDLETVLTDFAEKIEQEQEQFLMDVREMRKKQSAYFKERKLHGYTPIASKLLSESRVLERKVDDQLSDEPSLF